MIVFQVILLIRLLFAAGVEEVNNSDGKEQHALLFDKELTGITTVPEIITNGVAKYTKAGLKITGSSDVVQLNKFYAIAERKVQYKVRFSPDAVAVFRSSEGDFNAFIDVANKRISIATDPITETKVDFLRADHDYLVEVYHIYQKNKLRIIDLKTGDASEVVAVHDGQGGVGKGSLQKGFSVGMQWDHYCFGLKSGASMVVKRITVKALKNKVKLLMYGDSITQPEGYFPAKDFPLAWTQQVIRSLNGNAMSSGRGGATIDMVQEYIKNELPFIKAEYVMVTIGTNGGNTEVKLKNLIEYIKSNGATPILNNIPSNESSSQIKENALIDKVRSDKKISGCLFDLATSMNADGKVVDKSTMYWEDYTGSYGWQVYHHPNEIGGEKMFKQILHDLPELYAQPKGIALVPQPKEVTDLGKTLLLKKKISVYLDTAFRSSKHFVQGMLMEKGFIPRFVKSKSSAEIIFTIDPGIVKEKDGYKLNITGQGSKPVIKSLANSKTGLVHSLSTLHQLIMNNGDRIEAPSCEIYDYPYFPWRSFMLDEARHFQGMAVVKKLLDEMVHLKLNIFHWHLVDDPGWRLEIKKYPLLTEVGSRSNFSLINNKVTPLDIDRIPKGKKWYYTQDEIREIVQYADERGIVIVPEIEVPGHASASIYAYPWLGSSSKRLSKIVYGDLYDVTDPEVEQFLLNVLDEVMALFPAKIIHIGGDEANFSHWRDSPEINEFMRRNNIANYMDLQIWSINRFSKYITSKGGRMIGWNEITGENIRNEEHVQKSETELLAPGTIVQFWDGEVNLINKAIEKGYDVVNSNRFFTYLDYNYESTPLERMYSFNPLPDGLPEHKKKKILGLGGQMWGEYTPDTNRLYFQIFPRIAAISECGWVEPLKKSSFETFKKRLVLLESRWKKLGYWKH